MAGNILPKYPACWLGVFQERRYRVSGTPYALPTKFPPYESLPGWIPWQARYVYANAVAVGGFHNARNDATFTRLFIDEGLCHVWAKFGQALAHAGTDQWAGLISAVVFAAGCTPRGAGSKRSVDNPSSKTRIREQQSRADDLRKRAAEKAHELAEALRALDENGGQVPVAACNGIALIDAALSADRKASANCLKPFESLAHGLSSYAAEHFPKPADIVGALRESLMAYPSARELFADSPWLKSQKDSWRDGVRILARHFSENAHIYGQPLCNGGLSGGQISLTRAEWLALVRSILKHDASENELKFFFEEKTALSD